MYDVHNHTIRHDALFEMLPEEAMEKIVDYLDDDKSNISSRQADMEAKKDETWVEEKYEDCISNLCSLISDYYNIPDDGEIENDLEEYLGEEDYAIMGKDLAWWSVGYHGRDNGEYLSKDLTKFLHSYDGNYKEEILKVIDYILNVKNNGESVLSIIKNALGEPHYSNLVRSVDFDTVLGNAMSKYQKHRSSANQTYMFPDPQTEERFTPKDINDVVEMLTFGGYEEIATYVRTHSKQKIREHRIKLKHLIRKW